MKMASLLLTSEEHRLLIKFKKRLEHRYCVTIFVPDFERNLPASGRDIIYATVSGGVYGVDCVKRFMQDKMEERRRERRSLFVNRIPTITISDSSDSDSDVPDNILTERQQNVKRKNENKKSNKGLESRTDNGTAQVVDLTASIIIEDGEEALSTVEPPSKKVKIQTPSPAADFIPLSDEKEKENSQTDVDDSIIILDETPLPMPILKAPRVLRPVVIDGSNVAREHGKATQTFSCQGIKLAIQHFLQRGHTKVTAFVPQYRKHNKNGPIITTDQHFLEEMERTGHVVFTPSRWVNKKRITCYDDRFIVELATKTGGVILSNDNFRDIINENEDFRKTIEERLLMFCFVGDILMIPNDPLGRHGPCLEDFLSRPIEDDSPPTS